MKTIKYITLRLRVCFLLLHIFLRKPFKQKVVLVLTEHLGDVVAAEPIARYLKLKYEKHDLLWVVNRKYYDIIKPIPYLDIIINISYLSQWVVLKKMISRFRLFKIYDLHFGTRYCSKYGYRLDNYNDKGIDLSNYYDHGNLLEVFSVAAGVGLLSGKPILYLNQIRPQIDLPAKFIVLHSKSNEVERQWSDTKWSQLIHSFNDMSDIVFIEIGLTSTLEIRTKNYMNLCGKLNFEEISYLIQNSICFLGIDSSFAHFANALSKKSFLLFGQYKSFKSYTPYSDFDKNHFKILRQNGPLSEMSFDLVFEEFVPFVIVDSN